MIIVSKQSFECVNPNSGEKFSCRNMDIVTPPEWVASNPYFRMLCDAGLVTCHISSASVDAKLAEESEQVATKKEKKSK